MSTLPVEIVHLAPLRVAACYGFGVDPEFQAMNKLLAWARPRGLLDGGAAHRVFGFNNPSPTAASPHYGYELWIELHAAEAAGAAADSPGGAVELKSFGGGDYAVIRCRGVAAIPDAWRELVAWCEDSPYAFGQAQCLEQHIGALDGPVEALEFALYQAIIV